MNPDTMLKYGDDLCQSHLRNTDYLEQGRKARTKRGIWGLLHIFNLY